MTVAKQNSPSVLSGVKIAEKTTHSISINASISLLWCNECMEKQKYRMMDSVIKIRKDVFYRFMENPNVDWRKAMWYISLHLWERNHGRSDRQTETSA